MPDNTPNEAKQRRWKEVLIHELFEYLFNFALLSFFLLSFGWYRRLILEEYHIPYLGYWAPLVEAAVLAKVIMIGDALRMGRRMRNWPLVVPTIYRTAVFGLLAMAFTVLEHVVAALLHGRKAWDGIAQLTNKNPYELLAWCVVLLAAFLPFFTIKEIERAFGAAKIRGMFFRQHTQDTNSIEDAKPHPDSSKP